MDNQDIKTLVEQFNQEANGIKDCLTKLLVVVSDGRIPAAEDMILLDSAVQNLSNQYNEIFESTKKIVLPEEMPELGSSISKYVDAIENSKAKILKMQVEKAASVLRKFIRISSLIQEYAETLVPYQEKARDILSKFNEDTIEQLLSETEAPTIFLEAMEINNINSAEGFAFLENVGKYYPMQVQWGLVGRQYFLMEESTTELSQTKEESKDEQMMEEVITSTLESSAEIVETKVNDIESDRASEMVMNNETDDFKNVENQEIKKANKGEEEKKIVNETVIKEIEIEKSNKLIAINKPKITVPSASAFRKEIVKISKMGDEVRTILPLLTNLGVLTKEQFYLFGVCMDCFEETDKIKDNVDSVIELLASKGYLACFEYEEDGKREKAYCLTSYCYGSMQKDRIAFHMKGFWALSYGNYKVSVGNEIERETVIRAVKNNALLIEYFYAVKDALNKEEYQMVKQSIKWKKDHYQVAVVEDGIDINCYLVNPYIDINHIEDKAVLLLIEYDNVTVQNNKNIHDVFAFSEGTVSRLGTIAVIENSVVEGREQEGETDNKVEKQSVKEEQVSDLKQVGMDEPVVTKDDIKTGCDGKLEGLTPKALLELGRVPTDKEFITLIKSLISKNVKTKEQLTSAVVQSVLLVKGAGMEENHPESKRLSAQMRLATNLMLDEISYTSACLSSAFTDIQKDAPALMLAAYLYAMLTPSMAFDYTLKNQTEIFFANYDTYFKELQAFKSLFNKMMGVRDVVATGFLPAVIASLGSEAENEMFINELKKEAQACLTVKAPKTRMKVLPVMYSACFGVGSDLYECMEIIVENNKEMFDIVEGILAEYCDDQNGTYSISEYKIEKKLEKEWENATPKNKFKLEYDAREQALRQFRVRVNIILTWVEHTNSINNKKQDLTRLKILKGEIIKLIQVVQKDSSWRRVKYSNVLAWTMQNMQMYLNGKNSKLAIYAELLYTGVISLYEDGRPNMDETLSKIRYYEPWRNVLRHIVAKKKTVAELKAEILGDNLDVIDEEVGLKDNLHQLEMLGKHLGDADEDFIVTESQLREAKESAEDKTIRFQEYLELAYTYNRINETEKENISGIMTQYKGTFFENKDFACWRRFLDALEEQIQELSVVRKNRLRSELDSRLAKSEASPLLVEADRLLEEDMNFAVTEEYINRFDVGETELADELNLILHDYDYFSDFLSRDVCIGVQRDTK